MEKQRIEPKKGDVVYRKGEKCIVKQVDYGHVDGKVSLLLEKTDGNLVETELENVDRYKRSASFYRLGFR